MWTFVIPSPKQKHTAGSNKHTSNNYKQKATGHVTSLANGHLLAHVQNSNHSEW